MPKIVGPSQMDRNTSSGSSLSTEARFYIARSLRPNTRRIYAAQLRTWLAWRGLSDLEPADPIDVANFIAERANLGLSLSTLRTTVASLKAAHEAKGWPFNATSPAIIGVLRGVARTDQRLPRQAEPLHGAVLLGMLNDIAAGEPTIIDRRDAALLATGYLFALRRSELVGLDFEDQVCGDGRGSGVLRLHRSTIDVAFMCSKFPSSAPQFISVPRQRNRVAVNAIEAWLRAASLKPQQPLFWSLTRNGGLRDRLSDQTVSSILKSRVLRHVARTANDARKTGDFFTDPYRYSGHSLRVGFAVTAAECGADLRAIATITRHRSLSMPARYAQRADQLRTSPYQLEGVGLEVKR